MEHPSQPQQAAPGLGLQDLFFIVFRHKWKILIFSLLGLGIAAGVYYTAAPQFESQAKLLVRYVIDRSSVDAVDPKSTTTSVGGRYNHALNAEIEILSSWDLARQVATALGAQVVLPNDTDATENQAAAAIAGGLEVSTGKESNVISVGYRAGEPEIAVQVLQELITRYFTMHLEVHRSKGAFDFVSEQTDKLRVALRATESELARLRTDAGVLSLGSSEEQLSELKQALLQAEIELRGQEAKLKSLGGTVPTTPQEPASTTASEDVIEDYTGLDSLLKELKKQRLELLLDYPQESTRVRSKDAQIDKIEGQLKSIEQEYPQIVNVLVSVDSRGETSLRVENATLHAIQARRDFLKTQIEAIMAGATASGTRLAELERKRAVQEGNLTYFEDRLEKARVDEALDSTKIPNINVVQNPSMPVRVREAFTKKLAFGLAAGGIALGLVLAFLIELVFDRTIKRPLELKRLRVPMMLTIPRMKELTTTSKKMKALPAGKNGSGKPGREVVATNGSPSPWESKHAIRPYSDAIRDRLVQYFEAHKMTHKPKLVALTGFSAGSGTSTLATSLAAAFSEMGDGKVLLVDTNVGEKAEVHPFFKGRPVCTLSEALRSGEDVEVRFKAADKYLFLAKPDGESKPMIPKQLHSLLPKFKSSDFDYIIFDMPHLGPTSPTVPMASFMDMTLLVAEAEETDRDALKASYQELVGVNAKVACILNKAQTAAPAWMPSLS